MIESKNSGTDHVTKRQTFILLLLKLLFFTQLVSYSFLNRQQALHAAQLSYINQLLASLYLSSLRMCARIFGARRVQSTELYNFMRLRTAPDLLLFCFLLLYYATSRLYSFSLILCMLICTESCPLNMFLLLALHALSCHFSFLSRVDKYSRVELANWIACCLPVHKQCQLPINPNKQQNKLPETYKRRNPNFQFKMYNF